MKKLICLIVALMLLTSAAMAAEWGPGRSAAKPYDGVSEVDLNATMGYILLYPRETVLPAKSFCNQLIIYLPREDLKPAKGKISVYRAGKLWQSYDFSDPYHVSLRPLTEDELDGLIWGGGVCVVITLDESLTIGQSYYVTMEEGCFTNTAETVKSLAISGKDTWKPAVTGDYGVNAMRYTGDRVTFDLLLGGDAVAAVVYSNNDSVRFAEKQYTASGTITGEVTGGDVTWGVVFVNAMGDILDVVKIGE